MTTRKTAKKSGGGSGGPLPADKPILTQADRDAIKKELYAKFYGKARPATMDGIEQLMMRLDQLVSPLPRTSRTAPVTGRQPPLTQLITDIELAFEPLRAALDRLETKLEPVLGEFPVSHGVFGTVRSLSEIEPEFNTRLSRILEQVKTATTQIDQLANTTQI